MALKLGAYTACLHDRPLAEALEVLKANGLTSVEVNTGGFIPSPHCHVDLLLASEQARIDYLAEFSSRAVAEDSSRSTGQCGDGMNPPVLTSTEVRPLPLSTSRASPRGRSCRQAV